MPSNTRLPPALHARTAHESVLEDIEPWRDSTIEQRVRAVDELCALAVDLLRANPNRERVLAWQDPVPESTRIIWKRLMQRTARAR